MVYLDLTGKNLDGTGKNVVSTGKNGLDFLPQSAKHLAVTGKNWG